MIRLSHELANKAAEPEFGAVYARRNRGEFKAPTQFAEAMVAIEADSVIERAKVADELNIQENPTVEARICDMRAHKISSNEVYNRVLADIKAGRYKGPGGIPAMEIYENQFRKCQLKQVTP